MENFIFCVCDICSLGSTIKSGNSNSKRRSIVKSSSKKVLVSIELIPTIFIAKSYSKTFLVSIGGNWFQRI